MAQTGYTPIQLYYSTTTTNAPTAGNLLSGELAINITDGKLFYKDNGGVVQVLATKGTGAIGGSNTQVQFNSSGNLAGSANLTFDGTSLTLGGNPALSAGTANGVAYLNGSKVLTTGSALTFDGARLALNAGTGNFQLGASGDTSYHYYRVVDNGGQALYFGIDNSAGSFFNAGAYGRSIYSEGNYPLTFAVNSSEQMRLTSTGLGIGTSSPGQKLDVAGNIISRAGNKIFSDTFANVTGAATALDIQANGSSVLKFSMDGSERMRLDTSGNLGIGTSSPAAKLDVNGYAHLGIPTTGSDVSLISTAYGSVGWFGATTPSGNSSNVDFGAGRIDFSGNSTHGLTFYTSPSTATGAARTWTPRMTLDSSGNLGLGVTPSAWGTIFKPIQLGNGFAYVAGRTDGVRQVWLGANSYYNGTNWVYGLSQPASQYYQSDGAHIWNTAASGTAGTAVSFTQAMTLDASGRLIIGATASDGQMLKIVGGSTSGYATVTDGSGTLLFGGSGPLTGGVVTGQAALRSETGILFLGSGGTERARITSGGNLCVGSTSGSYRLNVTSAAGSGAQIVTAGATTNLPSQDWYDSINLTEATLTAGNGLISFGAYTNTPLAFITNNTERMRLDSSGNLGLGVTPSAWGSNAKSLDAPGVTSFAGSGGLGAIASYNAFHNGTNWVYKTTSAAKAFVQDSANQYWLTAPSGTAGTAISFTQTMTLDASGNLLVGATSSVGSAQFYALGSVANFHGRFRNTNAAPSGVEVAYTAASPNNTGNQFLYCADSTAERCSIRSNGGIANYQANNVNLSDRREKTNFAPAKDYLDTICAIPVQTFSYIDQNLGEDPGLTLGVVAQDVQAVAPELVMESNWGTEDNPRVRLSLYQTDLQYALMKCIQELKAQNDDLRARVAHLEALKGN